MLLRVDRRSFLRRLGVGTVAALALAHVPSAVIKSVGLAEPLQYRAASYLRNAIHQQARGRLSHYPKTVTVGRELYEALEGEMGKTMQFVDRHGNMLFKGVAVKLVGGGWYASFA
jgi:hypothetical protein